MVSYGTSFRKAVSILIVTLLIHSTFANKVIADTAVGDSDDYTIQVNTDGGTIGVFSVTDGNPAGSPVTVLVADDQSTAIYSNTFSVTGTTSLSSTLGVTGATTLGSTLSVSGMSTLSGIDNSDDGIDIAVLEFLEGFFAACFI